MPFLLARLPAVALKGGLPPVQVVAGAVQKVGPAGPVLDGAYKVVETPLVPNARSVKSLIARWISSIRS